MSKQVPSKEEQLLAERLRREAMESRPAFCESLHRRILTAVKQHRAAMADLATERTASRRRPRLLTATLAAACLLCAVAIGWQLVRNAAQQKTAPGTSQFAGPSINELPSINDLTDRTVGRLDHLSVSAAFEPQTTHLKHDVSAVASVFLDRLPVNVKVVENR